MQQREARARSTPAVRPAPCTRSRLALRSGDTQLSMRSGSTAQAYYRADVRKHILPPRADSSLEAERQHEKEEAEAGWTFNKRTREYVVACPHCDQPHLVPQSDLYCCQFACGADSCTGKPIRAHTHPRNRRLACSRKTRRWMWRQVSFQSSKRRTLQVVMQELAKEC
eukprot:TRINITY_DN50325_c0_g1_i1.p1 TRINITY_DN50325_c0_g1~~TRINITY_DN50325_c0_g1_i1.p1  ORF type:complete len:168 (+),score=14.66 TRINITY_DN50325_c0_g1_i1:206-709(+)